MGILKNSKYKECVKTELDRDSIFNLIQLKPDTFTSETDQHPSMLCFVLNGEVQLLCKERSVGVYNSNTIFLIPQYSQIRCKALSESILFCCDQGNKIKYCECHFSSNSAIPVTGDVRNGALPIVSQIDSFLSTMQVYLCKEKIACDYLFELKRKELLFLMHTYYPAEHLARFFFPLIGKDIDFKLLVLGNYLHKSMEQLAAITNCSLSTFQRRFKDNFGESFYQWILNQRADLIYDEILNTRKSFQEIAFEQGFSSQMHFNKFCKSKYGITPGEIRKK